METSQSSMAIMEQFTGRHAGGRSFWPLEVFEWEDEPLPLLAPIENTLKTIMRTRVTISVSCAPFGHSSTTVMVSGPIWR
jgi:hypothetical protein